jgi:septal ring factor EnvC (AmiA/AmiB activator)
VPVRIATLLAALVALLAVPVLAAGQDEGALRDRIASGKARERALGSALERLGRLEQRVAREVALVGRRVGAVQADLARSQARLTSATTRLRAQRTRLSRTRERLAEARERLATVLAGRYTTRAPDLTDVVLGSGSFSDLLNRMEFLRRVADREASVVRDVRSARDDARRRTAVLRPLVARRRGALDAVTRQRDALARMRAALGARQATLQRARAARAALLQATRAGRRGAERRLERLQRERAERELRRLEAQRRAAIRSPGPGGPWAIPWPVVECESGGQNLPPNFAGASGYYQFMPATWRGLGGSTPHAHLAPKAEQDRLAARLWAGGRGASNWVCAGLVGLL